MGAVPPFKIGSAIFEDGEPGFRLVDVIPDPGSQDVDSVAFACNTDFCGQGFM